MNLFVLGATGKTGKLVVEQAIANGHLVTAFVRSPQKLEPRSSLTIIKGEVLDKEALAQAMKGSDAVISCLGSGGLGKSTFLRTSAQNTAEAMAQYQMKRIAYLASAGIHHEIPGLLGKIVMFILRHVLEDHRKAIEYFQKYDLDYTIARPTGLNDLPAKHSYRTTLAGMPSKPERMISRADVATFLLQSIEKDEFHYSSVGISY